MTEPAPPLTVLYIGGVGRSGSTLLDRLLGVAPDVVSVGELVYLWRNFLRLQRLCGCGLVGVECPFWAAVLGRAFPGGPPAPGQMEPLIRRATSAGPVGRKLLRLGPGGARGDVAELQDAFAAIYRAIAAESGKRVIIDSGKHIRLALMLDGMHGVAVRLVHLVRDPRASAFSWTRDRMYPIGQGKTAPMQRLSPHESTLWWDAATLLGTLAPLSGLPTKRLHYEDLVAHPNETVAAIRRFAGLPPAPPPVDASGAAPLDLYHAVGGNPMRFNRGPTPIRLDDEWRQAMPSRQKALVTAMTLPWLAAYRYILPGGRRG